MGSTFGDLKRILSRVENKKRVGICFDTAHAYAAGYDLQSPVGVMETIQKFDSTLGLEPLKVVHLNDSQAGLGSGRDRHEHIGLGFIGEKGFRAFLKDERIRTRPFIMETPIDDRRDAAGNMKKARQLAA
jgi:deoxyribonuclease-4